VLFDDLYQMPSSTWGRMTGGSRDAFLALYQSHYQALFCYGFSISTNRELTKDCIQELFLEIWNTRPSLNKEVKNVKSYLFTWLRRKISRELSRLAKEKFSDELAEEFPFIQSSYEELLIAFQQSEEKKEQLRLALKKLTKKQLEIIKLKFFENLSYRSIASQTALTPRTVYNLMYEAIRHLRESMKLLLIHIMI
jgi:RNA polymerase sigma factor (sigma-70 family)